MKLLVVAVIVSGFLAGSASCGPVTEINDDAAPASLELTKARATILFFTADWAGPARIIKPALEKLAASPDIRLYVIQVEKAVQLARLHKIEVLPVTIVYDHDGKQLGVLKGANAEAVRKLIPPETP